MYAKYSEVSSSGLYPFAEWRSIILEKKQPRKIFVQSNTRLEGMKKKIAKLKNTCSHIFICIGEKVRLVEYEANHPGMIQAWSERFENSLIVYQALEDLWVNDEPFFC